MKISRNQSAFTLIELIVVISIIAILMALLIPQVSSAMENARRQSAATAVREITSACRNYYNDYGKFPPVTTAETGSGEGSFMSFGDTASGKCKVENNVLFDILRAIPRGENSNDQLNIRKLKFTTHNKAKGPKNPRDGFVDGTEFVGATQGQLLDPWGKQYCVVMETDGDEELDMGNFFQDLSGEANVLRFSVVAFSMGKNGEIGGKDYQGRFRKPNSSEAPDDIVSWGN